MRPSKSQHDLVEKKVPIEVLIEEENRKKNVGLSIGYEDEEIDPFDNNDFTIVDDYNTVRKNKDIEYNDQLESKILIKEPKKRAKTMKSLKEKIQKRKFENQNSESFDYVNFEDISEVKINQNKEKDSSQNSTNFIRRPTLSFDF